MNLLFFFFIFIGVFILVFLFRVLYAFFRIFRVAGKISTKNSVRADKSSASTGSRTIELDKNQYKVD